MTVCPECGSKKLKYTSEGLVCSVCGLVIDSVAMYFSETEF